MLRDIATDQGCGEPNAVKNLVSMFTRDRPGMNRDVWQEQRDIEEFERFVEEPDEGFLVDGPPMAARQMAHPPPPPEVAMFLQNARPHLDMPPSWHEEFEQFHAPPAEQLELPHPVHHRPLHRGWIEEFEETEEKEKDWGEEFAETDEATGLSKEELQEFEEAFAGAAHNGDAEWASEFQQQEKGDQWVESYESFKGSADDGELVEVARKLTQLNDPKLKNTKFMEFMSQIASGNMVLKDNDFVPAETGQDWADEYDGWGSERFMKHYEFAPAAANPYIDDTAAFTRGQQLFDHGDLSEAILAFEAAVQQDSTNSKAWELLGLAHAENDQDDRAIAALLHAIEADPNNRDAMMALAVSYTNESHKERAMEVLAKWLAASEGYRDIVGGHGGLAGLGLEGRFPEEQHARVSAMFLEAAQRSPEMPDPSVQVGLGLLYNMSCEYDKAVDCFKTALAQRPDDYMLWNKLGATLANSYRSEEALGPYFKALEIKPSYVRSRANLGIAYHALKMYPEAATYFLGALQRQPMAAHIWNQLQTVFSLMDRPDLLAKSMEYNVDLFRNEFAF